ncbi:hypothetical protein H6G76_36260 [Nostoc sp. FACHB-152]|uniref:hypothetical protein n=1 Tax=unclassified Nostoc TaxID=2593658 RepID=UPI001686A435|nr:MULTISPECIES: hypothetical protein [unclassified Nostoc]MBD2452458.1 hypothetical protein [Nostoc sp. FACHB-152]MBD2473368.1 hypothetical protein [Nostoc sp. FACHB-145]
MRGSISTMLTTLLVCAAILPAAAHTQTAPTSFNPYVAKQLSTNQLNSFNLASLGMRIK